MIYEPINTTGRFWRTTSLFVSCNWIQFAVIPTHIPSDGLLSERLLLFTSHVCSDRALHDFSRVFQQLC